MNTSVVLVMNHRFQNAGNTTNLAVLADLGGKRR